MIKTKEDLKNVSIGELIILWENAKTQKCAKDSSNKDDGLIFKEVFNTEFGYKDLINEIEARGYIRFNGWMPKEKMPNTTGDDNCEIIDLGYINAPCKHEIRIKVTDEAYNIYSQLTETSSFSEKQKMLSGLIKKDWGKRLERKKNGEPNFKYPASKERYL